MLGTQHLAAFITAGLLLNATPGPDTIYILGRTLSQGRSAGVASVFGISTGCLVHPRKKERDADRLTDAAAQVPAVRAASASQLFNVQIQITEGPYPVG